MGLLFLELGLSSLLCSFYNLNISLWEAISLWNKQKISASANSIEWNLKYLDRSLNRNLIILLG